MRKELNLTDTVKDVLVKMAEGNPGAITVMMGMMEKNKDGLAYILHLDDMNIRGTQIWIGYKDYCGQDMDKFIGCIKNRDKGMVDCINNVGRMGNHKDIAVQSGASFDRK